MSKIGAYNLELQEVANELGYDSTMEAIDSGVSYYELAEMVQQNVDGREEAHKEWLKEKKELVGDLQNLLIGMSAAGRSSTTDYSIVNHALEFISNCKEGW